MDKVTNELMAFLDLDYGNKFVTMKFNNEELTKLHQIYYIKVPLFWNNHFFTNAIAYSPQKLHNNDYYKHIQEDQKVYLVLDEKSYQAGAIDGAIDHDVVEEACDYYNLSKKAE